MDKGKIEFAPNQPDARRWETKADALRERRARRDMFAAAAMAGMFANPENDGDNYAAFANDARLAADAMIAELDRTEKQT